MKKILIAVALATTLGGCASFEPNIRDGKEYVGNYPVLYKGIVEDIQYKDKDGNLRSMAKEMSNTLETGTDSFGSITSISTGLSSAGGGLAVGMLSVLTEIIANSAPSIPPQIVVRKENDESISLAAPRHLLERATEFNCVAIGEPVKVVDDGQQYLYIMHADPRLQRRTAFEPSCKSLREKYDVPYKLSQTSVK